MITRAHYLRMAACLGVGAEEAMRMRPGLVFDMWELYKQSRRAPDDEERS